jgi:SAM-dependent methyltransferase
MHAPDHPRGAFRCAHFGAVSRSSRAYPRVPVRDLPFDLQPEVAAGLRDVLDVEGKLQRALESLGPVADRDVAVLGPADGIVAGRLTEAGARVRSVEFDRGSLPLASGTVDVVVAAFRTFRGVDDRELAAVDRVLRPSGRFLVVHDYGRDDISRLRPADLPEYTTWSRRDGPFLRVGFKIRVLHLFWTWPDIDAARETLRAFEPGGPELADSLRRPRATWNVAVYHRWRGGRVPDGARVPARLLAGVEGSAA